MSENKQIKILLKSNWESRITNKTKIYFLDLRDKAVIDEIFDKLYNNGYINWNPPGGSSFVFLVFIIQRFIINGEKKDRVIIIFKFFN